MQQYVTVNSNNRDVQNMEDSVLRVFSSLYNNPLLNGPTIVTGQIFTANVDLSVFHRLGKAVTGFIIINSNAPASIYQSSTKNVAPTAQIILKANSNVTADILFF